MPSMEQKKHFNDLKKILLVKLQAGSGGSDHLQNKGERLGNNVNVLKLWCFVSLSILELIWLIIDYQF